MVATSLLQNKHKPFTIHVLLSAKWSRRSYCFTALRCYYPKYYGNTYFLGGGMLCMLALRSHRRNSVFWRWQGYQSSNVCTRSQAACFDSDCVRLRPTWLPCYNLLQHLKKHNTDVCYASVAWTLRTKHSFQVVALDLNLKNTETAEIWHFFMFFFVGGQFSTWMIQYVATTLMHTSGRHSQIMWTPFLDNYRGECPMVSMMHLNRCADSIVAVDITV